MKRKIPKIDRTDCISLIFNASLLGTTKILNGAIVNLFSLHFINFVDRFSYSLQKIFPFGTKYVMIYLFTLQ